MTTHNSQAAWKPLTARLVFSYDVALNFTPVSLFSNNLYPKKVASFYVVDQMNYEMRVEEHSNPLVVFMHQMIPHHENAVNMAR